MKPLQTTISPAELAEAKKIIQETAWYRQAAASNFLYIGTPALGVQQEFTYPGIFCLSNEFEGYYSLQEFNKTVKEVIEKTKRNTSFIDAYYQKFALIIKAAKKHLKKAEKIDLQNISLAELGKIVQEIDDASYRMWNNCFLVDKFDPSGDESLKKECQKAANFKQEEIDILIRPQKINFIEQSNLELHTIALHLKRKKQDPLLLLSPFAKKWFFIQNSWGNVTFLKPNDFLQPLNDLIKESSERLQEVMQQYKSISKNTKNKVGLLYTKYKISPELKNIFHLFRTLGVIRDERKEIVLRVNHFNERVARRLAREFAIDVSLLRYALPKELALLSFKENLKRLHLNQRRYACFIRGSSAKIIFIAGKEAQELIALLHDKLLQRSEELKGMVACKGNSTKIKGRVKIILGETHFSKFECGDILVAPMTRPEYAPLMKCAKAIITDEGGITCHAAIISRELNVPCIIGTGIATKKLFDNREVEIDTEKGIIKIL